MAAKVEDLRKLKDQATRALEKRAYDRAAVLFVEIAAREPQPDWHQRAGEAFRRSADLVQAREQLERAAEGYAKGGFLLKAIAVCKTILQVDPAHTTTQRMLADLYAKRDSKSAAAPPPAVLGPHATMPPPLVQVAPPPAGDASRLAITEAMDADTHHGNLPIDVLPLHRVLGGRRSQQISVADVIALAEPEPAAYEITLDDVLADEDVEIVIDGSAPSLPTIPLFSSLGAAELQLLIERVATREHAHGEVIVRQGEPGASLYVVVDGAVRVRTEDRELARLEQGAFFGELALLTDEPRSATVVADGACTLLEISREVAWDVIRSAPEVLRTLLRFFRDRMLDRLMGTSPLFSALSPADARSLSDEFLFLELESGATAVKQGTRAPGLFFIVCGEVEVVREIRQLGRLAPGDVFGEMSLLDRSPASADVRATRKTWVLELPAQRFQEIMVTYPQVLEYVSQLGEQRRRALAGQPLSRPADGALDLLDLLSDERIDLL